MAKLTNTTTKELNIALKHEVKIEGANTFTLIMKRGSTVTVPDSVLKEKMVVSKVQSGILKSDTKLPDTKPKGASTNASGGSSESASGAPSKSGGDKGKEKTDGDKK